MPVHIHTPEEIAKMRVAGKLASAVLEMITPHVQPGITTEELDKLCYDFITDQQHAIPACVGYRGYQHTICASINEVVCHGIPSDRQLKEGDIVNLDVVVEKDGFHGDTSKMFVVGKGAVLAERLVRVTQECMYLGIKTVKPGAYIEEIGMAIQQHAEKNHFSVVEDFCGHGVGAKMHEEPQILHYRNSWIENNKIRKKPITMPLSQMMEPGMIFTIEPMINVGKPTIKVKPDGWTAITRDHSLSAEWEHTILVTETGYEVLTLRSEEQGKL